MAPPPKTPQDCRQSSASKGGIMRSRSKHPAIWGLVMVLSAGALSAGPAAAQKKATPGVTDTEIKIGQTMPYSGPASAYGVIGKAELAYFKMLNEKGGINGRKVTLMS